MGDDNRFVNRWLGQHGVKSVKHEQVVSWYSDDGERYDSEAKRDVANAEIAYRKWLVDTARAILWPEEVAAERRAKILAELREFLLALVERDRPNADFLERLQAGMLLANMINAETALEYFDELTGGG